MTAGVTSTPTSWTMRVAVVIPLLFPCGCSHTLAWRALKIGELLFARGRLGGVGFLGVSGQEVDEGCDLFFSNSILEACEFPVNEPGKPEPGLGLGAGGGPSPAP